MYVNTPNIAALIVLVFSIGLAFLTPYSLIATALSLGFLAIMIIKANKEYPARVNKAVEQLNACMMELADFKQFYNNEKSKKDQLKSKVEYL